MQLDNQALDPSGSRFITSNHYEPFVSFPTTQRLGTSTECFEIRVIFVTIRCSNLQSSLKIVLSPRHTQTSLQINGSKIQPSEKICRVLNRHKTDLETSESIYVNTDRIQVSGHVLQFELQNQGCVLVSGSIRDSCLCLDHGGSHYNCFENGCMGADNDWLIEFEDGGNLGFSGGFVDIYFGGRSRRKAVLLNGVVELNRWNGLDCISEGDKSKSDSDFDNYKISGKETEDFEVEGGIESEGELSRFNAGVKVGMGLGLGMCLGVGVGIGLVIRTYQATTGAFRRLFM